MTRSIDDVLDLFDTVNKKELHVLRGNGTRLWDDLAKAAQECSPRTSAPQGRQHSNKYTHVLDFLAQHGYTPWLCAYVHEVCKDRSLTSNETLEAQLLDAAFIRHWCRGCIQEIKERVRTSLADPTRFQEYLAQPGGLRGLSQLSLDQRVSAVVGSVLNVLDKMAAQPAARTASSNGAADTSDSQATTKSTSVIAEYVADNARLQQLLALVRWLHDSDLALVPSDGAFGSHRAWALRVHERRQARHAQPSVPKMTFVEDILHDVPVSASYPFHSVPQLLDTVRQVTGTTPPAPRDLTSTWCCLSPPAAHGGVEQRWHACLAMVLYTLTDMGELEPDTDRGKAALERLSKQTGVPTADLMSWCAAAWLDDALVPAERQWESGRPTLGARAAALLSSRIPQRLSISFLQVLSQLGYTQEACQLQGCTQHSVTGTVDDRDTAWAIMRLKLGCGLLGEAMNVARGYAQQQPDACTRFAELRNLLQHLLSYCVEGPVDPAALRTLLLDLCVSDMEVAVLVEWLFEQAKVGRAVGQLLPVLLASRGLLPEAVAAGQAVGQLGSIMNDSAAAAHVDAVLEAAAAGLPLPLRNVRMPPPPAQSDMQESGSVWQLFGLNLTLDRGAPVLDTAAQASATMGFIPPPLAATRAPTLPAGWATAVNPVAAQAGQAAASAFTAPMPAAAAFEGAVLPAPPAAVRVPQHAPTLQSQLSAEQRTPTEMFIEAVRSPPPLSSTWWAAPSGGDPVQPSPPLGRAEHPCSLSFLLLLGCLKQL